MEGPYGTHEYILSVSDIDIVTIGDRHVFGTALAVHLAEHLKIATEHADEVLRRLYEIRSHLLSDELASDADKAIKMVRSQLRTEDV